MIIYSGKFTVRAKKAIEFDIQSKYPDEDNVIVVFNDPTDQVAAYYILASDLVNYATPVASINKKTQIVKPDLDALQQMGLTPEIMKVAYFKDCENDIISNFYNTGIEISCYNELGLTIPDNLIIVEDVEVAISKKDLVSSKDSDKKYWYVDENLLPGIMNKAEYADMYGIKRTTLNNKIAEGSDLYYRLEEFLVEEKPKGKCKYKVDTQAVLDDYESIENFLSLTGLKSSVFKPMTRASASFELVKKYLVRS